MKRVHYIFPLFLFIILLLAMLRSPTPNMPKWFMPRREYAAHIDEAEKLIGTFDIDDVPFLALALALSNDVIWSEDEHFTRQMKVKVWKTRELVTLLDAAEAQP